MHHSPENTGWRKSYSSLLLLSGHNPKQFNRLPNMCCHVCLSSSFFSLQSICSFTATQLAIADKGSTGLGHWAWPLGWPWARWAGLRVIGSPGAKPIQEGKQWQIWMSSSATTPKTTAGQKWWPTSTITTRPLVLFSAWTFFFLRRQCVSPEDAELLSGSGGHFGSRSRPVFCFQNSYQLQYFLWLE